jgi:hypothetical protein
MTSVVAKRHTACGLPVYEQVGMLTAHERRAKAFENSIPGGAGLPLLECALFNRAAASAIADDWC